MKQILLAIFIGTLLAYSITDTKSKSFKEHYTMEWIVTPEPFNPEDSIIIPRTVRLPTKTHVDLCSTVGCQKRINIHMHDWLLEEVKLKMSLGIDPVTERKALAKTIAYLELQTCDRNRTCYDRPGVGGDPKGQLDCVDESMNTTSYMLWLEKHNLLKFHNVTLPDWKGWHHFATMCKKNGVCFVVESDFNKTGQEPNIYRR